MWVDFIENIYQYGKCESIGVESDGVDGPELTRRLWYFITYKVLSALPLTVFSSFILATLTYRTILNLIDFCFISRSATKKYKLLEESKDTFCCSLCNLHDENEILYCRHDLQHVLDLFEKKSGEDDEDEPGDAKSKEVLVKNDDIFGEVAEFERLRRNNAFKYIVIEKKRSESTFWRLFRRFVYDWDPNYKFSSRFVNTMVVGLVALYYFFLFITYLVSITITQYTDLINLVTGYLEVGSIPINLRDISCMFGDQFCLEYLSILGTIPITLPNKYYKVNFDLVGSILCVFIIPTIASLLFCLLHVGLLVRETKENIQLLRKGKCEFVRSAEFIGNAKIAASSFHFGG
jgi:hypothetical protein